MAQSESFYLFDRSLNDQNLLEKMLGDRKTG